jgi:hypothetical protein
MTLYELYSDPAKRKQLNWWKVMEKLIELSTDNRYKIIDTYSILKRYRLICRQCQIQSAMTFVYARWLTQEQKFNTMLLSNINNLVKRG